MLEHALSGSHQFSHFAVSAGKKPAMETRADGGSLLAYEEQSEERLSMSRPKVMSEKEDE